MKLQFVRAAFIAVLCLGCSRSDSWKVSHIQSGSTEFSSSRLSYHTKDLVNGIDAEFLSVEDSCHLYLHVHSHPIRPYKGDAKKALVQIKTPGETKNFIAHRHEGGQRLLLSEEAKDYIVKALHEGENVVVSTSGYSSTLTAESFDKKYYLLEKPPRFRNPLYSPL